MADNPQPDSGSHGSHGPSRSTNFGFLTRKIGPLPIWAYAAIAVGIYYWYTHYGPGASKSQTQAGTNPQTGHPYAQDLRGAQTRVRILESEKTGTGHRDHPDHGHPKDIGSPNVPPIYGGTMQSGVNPGGPEVPGIPRGVNPGGPMVPVPGHGGHGHDGHGGQGEHIDVNTRWRGPYRHPHQVPVDQRPTRKPDHRPLGV